MATTLIVNRFISRNPKTVIMKLGSHVKKITFGMSVILMGFSQMALGQYCDSLVPSFVVDLTGSPNMNWVSPMVVRDGNCCGTSAPDNCLEFVITLHPSAIAVNFNIAGGAVPPGALFYQIDCGPVTPVGSPICLYGPGPHTLTFCKPGNNSNSFSITSYSEPIIGPDITLNAACDGFIYAQYYNEPSISWTSIAPGPVGTYDNLLSCTTGCDTTYLTAPVNGPPYIDYLVCGDNIASCNPAPICDTVRVYLVPPVQVAVSSPITALCPGETTTITATVSGGTGPYNVSWSNGSTASAITVGPGTYTVNVTDASGCFVATDNITIVAYPIPNINAGPDQTVCFGSPVTLNATGGVSYTWNNGVQNGISFVQSVGTVAYTVIGTDANGCEGTDQALITVQPLPVVNAGPDASFCAGTSITLNGSGASTYAWNNGVVNGVGFTQPVGTTQYTVIGTDANGCQNTDFVNITVNPLPSVFAGNDVVLCQGSPVTLVGSGATSYTWDNGVSNGVSFIPGVGSTIYTVTGTDANGCQNIDQVNVVVNPNPIVDAGPDQVLCQGETVTLTAAGALYYVWTPSITNGVAFTQPLGTQQYTVVGTDANGCANSDVVLVQMNPTPIVLAGNDIEGCEGQPIILYAVGSDKLFWNNGVYNGVPFYPNVGVTQMIVTDSLDTGCLDSDTLLVTIYPNPEVSSNNAEICEGEPVVLTAVGANQYDWTLGISNGVTFYPTQSAIYHVVGTDIHGCKDSTTSEVIVHAAPVVDFKILNPSLTTTEATTGFDNLTTGASSFSWDFGDGGTSTEYEPTHTFPTDHGGEYVITLTAYSPEGCPGVREKYVHVFRDYTIYVPNAFTPDANGVNEIFKPVMDGFDPQDYVMYIFNRWGDIVFETHDMNVGWDGTFSNQEFAAQDNVYVWKIIAGLAESSDTKIFVGHVTLLK